MIIPPLRFDQHGSGEYLAKRGDREHQGVDLTCDANKPYFSDISGRIERIGHPYNRYGPKAEYKLIQIRFDAQTVIKYMYLSPLSDIKSGVKIERGECIGHVQDLTKVYPAITNHVHLEVWVEGVHVNPLGWLEYRGWA